MQNRILAILEELNIEIVYIDKDEYCENEQIVYSTKENPSSFYDDNGNASIYDVYITYKYRDLSNVMKYQDIKEHLKKHGLIFKEASDDLDEEVYIKEMLFEIEAL